MKISPNHNYDNGYIGLIDLTVKRLPDKVEIEGNTLIRKSEFHISLICAKKVARLINSTDTEIIQKDIVDEFKRFIQSVPLTEYRPLNVYRFVQRDERKTLVLMVEVPHLQAFFQRLEEKYHTNLPMQPTHITLYTLQPEAGIGILSQEELDHDSRIVQVPAFDGQHYAAIRTSVS